MHLASVIDLFTHNTHAHTHRVRGTHATTSRPTDPTDQLNRQTEGKHKRGGPAKDTQLTSGESDPDPDPESDSNPSSPYCATVADTNHLRPSLRSVDAICNDIFIYTRFFPSLSPLCFAVVCSLRSIMLFPVSCGQQTRERKKEEY